MKGRRLSQQSREVAGIERIYCGHNIVRKPTLAGNIHCIDTGAYLGEGEGEMTVLDIYDDGH